MMSQSKIGFLPAISIVIANMVGVGVFTSLGFQLNDLTDYRAILMIWIIGGMLALLGSLCYAELSSTFPQSGGEYHFLRISFGNLTGFLSGWTSAILGFAAPIAAAAHAFATYFTNVIDTSVSPIYISASLILLITLIHAISIKTGTRFQVYFTVGKVAIMILFITAGLVLTKDRLPLESAGTVLKGGVLLKVKEDVLLKGDFFKNLSNQAFWIGLIFVSYAYSGWNASAYMIDDIKNPVKNVPRSIIIGTVCVILLYTLINFVFLKSTPANQLRGQEDVAHIAATSLFGSSGAKILSGLISFFLISTISSMIIVGPRVIKRISQDYTVFKYFSADANNNVPLRALLLQSGIALLVLITSSFEFIITSIGFILTIFTTLTAASVILMRYKMPDQPRILKFTLYPIAPILYCVFNLWILYFTVLNKPYHVLSSLIFLAIGGILYVWVNFKNKIITNVLPILFISFALACNDNKPKTNLQSAKTEVSDESQNITISIDSIKNQRSDIISGRDIRGIDLKTLESVKRLDENWLESEKKIFFPINEWRKEEKIQDKTSENYGVFYPFSGPDLPFVQAFYPAAKLYVLVGLEKAGDSSSIMFSRLPDYKSFITNAERYFYFSGRMGFFRTMDMEKQFSQRGVVDILAFYLKKSKCDIVSIDLLKWNGNKLQDLDSNLEGNNVCHIKFLNTEKKLSEMYYFQKDLSDEALKTDSTWFNWLKEKYSGLKVASLLKSASYLLHRSNFSSVRNFIIENSSAHIQDDSGIGFGYILDSKKEYRLYGKYTRTIPMFRGYTDRRLIGLYDSLDVKPLPFKIGYNISHGESNLLLMY